MSTLAALAFLGGAAIMSVELIATRLASQLLGASLYTWTASIGVVLAGIMAGNYLGGRLADAAGTRRALAGLFLLVAMAVVALPSWSLTIDEWEFLWRRPIPQRVAMHVAFVFAVPTLLMGMIAPMVARLGLSHGRGRGRTIGVLSAWGTVGSIVGTFATGFVLIAWLGSGAALCLIALTAAVAGWLLDRGWWLGRACILLCSAALIVAIAPQPGMVALAQALALRPVPSSLTRFIDESAYSLIRVERDPRREANTLVLDQLTHSVGKPEDPRFLGYDYERIYSAVTDRCRPADHAPRGLVIGGGGFTFPRYFLDRFPDGRMNVAEIDPAVTRVAVEFFGLKPDDPRLEVANEDGRAYVRRLLRHPGADGKSAQFDFVYGDAVNDYAVPHHLTTLEYVRMIDGLLTPDGLYLLNLIERYESGRFLGAVLNTMGRVFPHLYVYGASGGDPAAASRDTYVVIGSKRPLELGELRYPDTDGREYRYQPLRAEHMEHLKQCSRGVVLTDDFAPVQQLLAEVVLKSSRYVMAYCERGTRALNDGDLPAAERYLRRAAEIEPTVQTRMLLAAALVRSGGAARMDEALRLYADLLKESPDDPDVLNEAGTALLKCGRAAEAIPILQRGWTLRPNSWLLSVHLAQALVDGGRYDEALEKLEPALRQNPASAEAWLARGFALSRLGRNEEAASALSAALQRDPQNARARFVLGTIAMQRGDSRDAAEQFRASLQLQPDDPRTLFNLGLALSRLNQPEPALRCYRDALRVDPAQSDARFNLANLLLARRELDAAANEYHELIRRDPAFADAYVNLCRLELLRDRPADARQRLEDGLRHAPDSLPLQRALAQLLAMHQDPSMRDGRRAVELARRAAAASQPAGAESLFLLAAALAQDGQFDEAVKTAEEARRSALDADNAALVELLDRCLQRYRANKPYPAADDTPASQRSSSR